jgi:hypothetical protein
LVCTTGRSTFAGTALASTAGRIGALGGGGTECVRTGAAVSCARTLASTGTRADPATLCPAAKSFRLTTTVAVVRLT